MADHGLNENIIVDLHQELNQLHTWKVEEELTDEQRLGRIEELKRDKMDTQIRLYQETHEKNDVFLAQAMEKFAFADSETVIDDVTISPMPIVKKGWKESRAKQKLTEKAKKESGIKEADYVSHEVRRLLLEHEKEVRNSLPDELGAVIDKNETNADLAGKVDLRQMKSFLYGYKKNKHGDPLNEEEQKKKEHDEKVILDYTYETGRYKKLKNN